MKTAYSYSHSIFIIMSALTILQVTSGYINLIFPKLMIQTFMEKRDFIRFVKIVVSMVSLNLFISSISTWLEPKAAKQKEVLNARVIDEFLKKSISLRLSYFEEKSSYDRYTLVFDKSCTIFHTVIDSFFKVITSLLQIIIVISMLSWMNTFFFVILLVVAILQTLIGNIIKRISYQLQVEIVPEKKRLSYIYRLFYIPEFMRDVRINALFDFVFKKKKIMSDTLIENIYLSKKKISKILILQILTSTIETIAITIYFGLSVFNGVIWIDTFVVSHNSYTQLKNAVMSLLSIYNSLFENDLYLSDYLDFMRSDNIIFSGKKELEPESIFEIEYRNVTFSYPNSNKLALNHVSFKIKKGDKILIVGKNGSGKTTLVKLLLRLYEPKSGNIYINGTDITEFKITELRKSIAVLFQDYPIYAFSVKDNLCMGENISENLILDVIMKVGLNDLIKSLRHGLDTPVSCQFDDDGVEFSGGEKQRLAIARTLLRERGTIILDEPTSNLDSTVGRSFFTYLLSDQNKSKTIVLISHQYSIAPQMTKIVCLDKCTITNIGTHEELLNSDIAYQHLFEASCSGVKK